MLLRNWYNYWKSMHSQQAITNGIKNVNNSFSNSGINNTSASAINGLILLVKTVSTNYANNAIVLGSGTTPPTLDDYVLESLITSGLSFSLGVSVNEDNDGAYVITATNTTDADIIIGEVGICENVYTGTSASSTSTTTALLERTVLDSPVTIPAGGVGVIEYKIALNIPTE